MVGPTAAVLAEFGEPAIPTLDASGWTVLPGLVESHCHPLFAPAPAPPEAERLPLDQIVGTEDSIAEAVATTREASDSELLDHLTAVYSRILAGGATTLEVKSGYGLTVDDELRALRLLKESQGLTPMTLAPTFLGAHVTPVDAKSPEAYMRTVLDEMLPRVLELKLAEFIDVSCDDGIFDVRLVEELLARARDVGIPARVHADGWAASDGWRTAVAGGALVADHLTYTSDEDIIDLGATDTIATLLPVAELVYLCDRRANARLLIEQEVPVAIATDFCSSVHSTSLCTTVGLAAPWFRMSPSEAIVGATLNAAHSLQRGHDRGSLDVGKRGDLTILACSHPNEIYVALGSPLVAAVVIDGKYVWASADASARLA
jgi:imidazolonepropionase